MESNQQQRKMNIEDFKPKDYTLQEVFDIQKELMFRYNPELRNHLPEFDIDLYEDQELFKKYCWRITEELTEALEDISNENHFKEELIDSFNFLIDLYQIYGFNVKDVIGLHVQKVSPILQPGDQILNIIYQLGITANLLKNRQWRRSQYLVDLYKFEPRFKQVWIEFMVLFNLVGLSPTEVIRLWSLKYQVNLFRLNTNY